MLKTVILIPARFASTRYPGKPLVDLKGKSGTPKPLIQRSYEAAVRVPGIAAINIPTTAAGSSGRSSLWATKIAPNVVGRKIA